MPRFLVDENLPRSIVSDLIAHGHEAMHVKEVGLAGKPDADVFQYAVSHSATLVSADLDFSDVRAYPLGTYHGVVIVRLPDEVSVAERKRIVLTVLSSFQESELQGSLVIIDPGGVRIRGTR